MICFFCGDETVNRYNLCERCKPDLLDMDRCCSICGIHVGPLIDNCPNCISSVRNFSLFPYIGRSKILLNLYKFNGIHTLSSYFSRIIFDFLHSNYQDYIVVPIPTTFLKKRVNGWYQLDPIVKGLKRNGVEVRNLLKKRKTLNQKKLSREDRQINMENSFLVKSEKTDKRIVLLDDVFTTGATIYSAYKILSENGYRDIVSLTLFRD